MKNIAAAPNAMLQHKEYGCSTNTKHHHHQADCFLFGKQEFFPKPFWFAVERFLGVVVYW